MSKMRFSFFCVTKQQWPQNAQKFKKKTKQRNKQKKTIHKWWHIDIDLHQGLRGAELILDQRCFNCHSRFNIFKPHNKASAMIFMTPHDSVRVGPQRWTPSCGRYRFSAEGILLPLPNKSKMCQHNLSLVSSDQSKYLKTSTWSRGQRECLTLMCSCVRSHTSEDSLVSFTEIWSLLTSRFLP